MSNFEFNHRIQIFNDKVENTEWKNNSTGNSKLLCKSWLQQDWKDEEANFYPLVNHFSPPCGPISQDFSPLPKGRMCQKNNPPAPWLPFENDWKLEIWVCNLKRCAWFPDDATYVIILQHEL